MTYSVFHKESTWVSEAVCEIPDGLRQKRHLESHLSYFCVFV